MKILVIDDKKENREAAIQLLSNHEVTTIGTYDEALNLIKQTVADDDVLRALGRSLRGCITIDNEFQAKVVELTPKFDFDIVLIDLMMPASDRTLGHGCEHTRGVSVPYGFPLMIKVAMAHAERVKHIAIVSDVNHHNHAMSAALDPLGGYGTCGPVMMNGIPCSFIHAHLQQDGSKDWNYALKRVISPKDVLVED